MSAAGPPTALSGWRVDLERLRRDHRGRVRFAGTEAVSDLTLPNASVPSGEVSHVLVVDAAGTEVEVSGTVEFGWSTECRRCLERVEGTGHLEVREVFQSVPTEGETWPIVDEAIDLEPMVRELVLLALPLAPVCSAGCRGPDDAHPVTTAAEADAAAEDARDPRWAALDQLDFD